MRRQLAVRLSLVVVAFVVVQETLVLQARVGGVHPDVMVLLPIAAAIVGGPARGAIVGFVAGLVADLFLPTPFGLSALVGSLVGYGVGIVTAAMDRTAWWLPPMAAVAGSVGYELLYAGLGALLGQPQMLHVNIVGIVVLVASVNALVSVIAVRMTNWALPAASTEGMPTSAGMSLR